MSLDESSNGETVSLKQFRQAHLKLVPGRRAEKRSVAGEYREAWYGGCSQNYESRDEHTGHVKSVRNPFATI